MCLYPNYIKVHQHYQAVPCGKCMECLVAKSNEWAVRIMLEASLYEENCFLTLTYNDDNLPAGGLLVKRDHQLFMKSFRKAISPRKIRFFCSGEYGGRFQRPHFHYIIFNWSPPDTYPWRTRDGIVYRSDFVADIWKKGFVSVGDVEYKSAFYCAKYMQKFAAPDKEVQPFLCMSNRPGIGAFAVDPDILHGKGIYLDGRKCNVPRYFIKRLENLGYNTYDIKFARAKAAYEALCSRDPSYMSSAELHARKKDEKFKKRLT